MRHLIEILLGCVVAACYAAAFFWGRIPRRFQSTLILVANALGFAGWLFAFRIDGVRTADVRCLLYHHHYVVDHAVAFASRLPFVVGSVLLAAAACALYAREKSGEPRSLAYVALVALAATAIRIVVDRAAASEPVAHAFGILWMAPVLGINATLLPAASRRNWILAAAYVSRLPPIVATVVATHYRLGTHYSLGAIQRIELPFVAARILCTPLDGKQWLLAIAIPQLVLWPLLTALVAALSARAYQRWNAG